MDEIVDVFYMPEECLIEILARLPVKTLIRFKSVCKTWLSIISNPSFITSQLHNAITASKTNPTVAILSDYRHHHLINEVFLDVSRHYFSSYPINVDSLVFPPQLDYYLAISNKSYNGIICLIDRSHVGYLWNPSIRQYLKLPPSPYKYTFHLGFGYDSISGSYKVIRFMFGEDTTDNYVPIVLVYSTATGCWKDIRAPNWGNKFRYMDQIDVVVDGVLYADCEDTIISLDLHEEVFGLVPYPEFVQRKGSSVLDFEGSVAMVFDSVVWTLDDVCGKVSWTKRFSVKEYDSAIIIWLSYYLGAGVFYGSKFLLKYEFESELLYKMLYDCEKKEDKCFVLQQRSIPRTMKYTETLVSLDGFQYFD
ncbi:putative F-box protein At3g16210 [Daucus carota subsp. sativus]|uniref:putative F-box protein At3g16210 n=1 Tax=Daucus carota subsp. sativus TaxID=79200 RepID=UPI0007EFCA9E|nr:PREDICTED: putative F-box protein At3g16210 [Daucus carota subsp. sativus]